MASDLEIRIGADLTEIKGALATLKRDLGGVGTAAKSAGGANAMKGLETGARSAAASVGRLVAGLVSAAAILKTIGVADELTTLNARLKLATNSTEEFTRAQVALFDLAQRSRADLGETVRLYTSIGLAVKEAGVGQETLLQVVETINQAVSLSGSSAAAAQAALVQLGQGLASGTLRGEELNSILEQTPALADAIAKGMGITRGELRKYGEEGKITAERVIAALQNQREEVDRQFKTLPLTVGGALTQLRNAGQQLVGVFDTASGATSGLATVIGDFATFLSSDAVAGAVVEFAATWSESFRTIVEDAKEAVRIMKASSADIVGSGEDVVDILGRAFRELPVNVRTAIQIVTVQAAALFDRLISYATLVKDNFKAIFTDDTQDAAFARFQRRNAAIASALQGSVDASLNERTAALSAAKAIREKAAADREAARALRTGTGQGNFTNRPSAAQAAAAKALAKAQLDAQEKLADDSAKRQLQTLENQFADSTIAARDYYRRREEIELASIERSIALERQRASAGGADAVKALAEVEILERSKADVRTRAARDAAEFERGLAKQLADARAQQLENEGNTVEAARIQAEAKYKDLIARLQSEGDTAGVALIRKLIGSEVADAELAALSEKINRTLADLRGQESLLAAQVDAGMTPQVVAEQQLQGLRATSITQLQTMRQAVADLIATTQANGGIVSPETLELLRQTDTEIARITASTQTLQNSIKGEAVDAATTFFTDLATSSKSAGDALTDFVRNFVTGMATIGARALATYAVLQLLDAIYPGLGKIVAASGSVGANVNHSGGMVGTGPRRSMNPLIFAGAPRMHSGGMVGLKPDERPAILQTGEEVLARGDPRNAANGSGGGAGTRIINVIDPSMVSDYLSSSAGEKTILNVLERNPGAVRQFLT